MLPVAVMERSFALFNLLLLLCRYESTMDQLYNLMGEHLETACHFEACLQSLTCFRLGPVDLALHMDLALHTWLLST